MRIGEHKRGEKEEGNMYLGIRENGANDYARDSTATLAMPFDTFH